MKKIIYIVILLCLFTSNAKAFDIDVDKIKIGSKSETLINKLNDSYKIDIDGFSKEEIILDEKIDNTVIDLVKVSLSDKNSDEKKKDFTSYQYYSNEGGETLATVILIETYLQKLEELQLEASYIKEIKSVSFNDNDVLSFVYLSDGKVNGTSENVILVYWLKKDGNDYRLFYPWLTLGDDINSFFKKVSDNEDNGEIVSGTYKEISLNGTVREVSSEQLNSVYQKNSNSVVQLTGMNSNGSNMYGSGFFIREGVIATTWSLFSKFLTNSNYVYVNDASGKTYQVKGVIAAQIDYDIVILKISENVGRGVNFGDSTKLNTDDSLFIINSINNDGFSIKYGKYVSNKDGRMKNMFLLNNSDEGAALFNLDGDVVGITSGDKVNSELSYANSTNYLKRLQLILNGQTYDDISYTILETFKQAYYMKTESEKSYNYIDGKIWDKYKNIGKIEDTIKLDLIKGNYVDKILSLRYKCNTSSMIDTMFTISSYTEELVLEGYKLTYEDNYKQVYQNNKYKIIIKSSLQYLIILVMEI